MITRDYFWELSQRILEKRKPNEWFSFDLKAEDSEFCRLNHSKIRQMGAVNDSLLTLSLFHSDAQHSKSIKKVDWTFHIHGNLPTDLAEFQDALNYLRDETAKIPADPFARIPENHGNTDSRDRPETPCTSELFIQEALPKIRSNDLVGIFAAGPIIRANFNSEGQFHWHESDGFNLDFSVYGENEAASNACYAGKKWNTEDFLNEVHKAQKFVEILEKPRKKLIPGKFHTFLSPIAVNELLSKFSWGFIGESFVRQDQSPLRWVRSGERSFSPLFSLVEDFSDGWVPRFNEIGEVSPERIPLIEKGKLVSTLISSRTAREYDVPMNGASQSEGLRSPIIGKGALSESNILSQLGTGLYLSHLHYINWSDQIQGRLTGMTRYAALWIENGKIAAPIENMCFDENVFHLFGSGLEDLTDFQQTHAEVLTYEHRRLGRTKTPGILIRDMNFTL